MYNQTIDKHDHRMIDNGHDFCSTIKKKNDDEFVYIHPPNSPNNNTIR